MSRRKKKAPRPTAPVPTRDFLEGFDPGDPWKLQEAVENFIFRIEDGRISHAHVYSGRAEALGAAGLD